MGYITKSKRCKMQDHYKYNVRAPRSPLSVALKIQPKLLLKQTTSPHHRVSHQHQRENGQRGRQACSSSAEPQPKKKELESEEDQKRKGHIPEPERGPQHHQEHQAEEAGGRGRVSESSAASPATPRQGGPSLPPGTAFQAPHCAQAGTP